MTWLWYTKMHIWFFILECLIDRTHYGTQAQLKVKLLIAKYDQISRNIKYLTREYHTCVDRNALEILMMHLWITKMCVWVFIIKRLVGQAHYETHAQRKQKPWIIKDDQTLRNIKYLTWHYHTCVDKMLWKYLWCGCDIRKCVSDSLLSSILLSLGFNSKDKMMRYIKVIHEQVEKRRRARF